MNLNLKDITFVIVTYKSEKVINTCLNSTNSPLGVVTEKQISSDSLRDRVRLIPWFISKFLLDGRFV